MNKLNTGKIIQSTGSWYNVIDSNNKLTKCRLIGAFRIKGIRTTNPVAVGDVVDFKLMEDKTGAISNIHPRTNYIIRKATKLSKASHIIAANIDQVLIVASLIMPRTSTGFIDRILTTAEAYHIPAKIVFNKCDLYKDDDADKLNKLIDTYEQIGYQCLETSVTDNTGIEDFKTLINDRTTLIAGHSGVGKSALISAVDHALNIKIGRISEYHSKGMHTTTYANMYKLEFGGWIIDTPGIKEFGLYDFDKAELGHRFPEIRCHMQECRFNNCSHVSEPGCAVKSAVENGQIAAFRYENYLNMLNSI